MTLIDLRRKISTDLLMHLIFGHQNIDYASEIREEIMKSICGYWTIFLSEWALDLRNAWLSIRRNRMTGIAECFEITLSSEFRHRIERDMFEKEGEWWSRFINATIDQILNQPKLKFAILYQENKNNRMPDAIIDWSPLTVTFKNDRDFIDSMARKRRWLILDVEENGGSHFRKNRLHRFLRLFEECSDWVEVMERNLKLNICCALSNLGTIDEIGQLEF